MQQKMKYTKHFTWKAWKKFNTSVQPDNTFSFINFHTKKKESYDYLTMQEVLLKKYKIILDEYEPKWPRRYHSITAVVNQKNLDKSITSFNKMVNAFSSGLGDTAQTKRKSKKDHDVLFGKSKSTTALWEKSKKTSIWGDKPKRKSKKKSNSLNIWNDDKKTPLF